MTKTLREELHLYPVAGITDRNLEVFGHLRRGLTYKQVAAQMRISVSAVKGHIVRVERITHTTSVKEALAVLVAHGLL